MANFRALNMLKEAGAKTISLQTLFGRLKNIIIDWILCPGEIKDYAIKTKILLSVDWLKLVTCNKIIIVVTN
jgi:hypothetical protein